MLDYPVILDAPDCLVLSTDDPLVFEKEAIYVGDFKKRNQKTGEIEAEFSVDEMLLDHWVKTHGELIAAGLDVPMPVGHTSDPTKRAATVESLIKKLDSKGRIGLFARLRFKNLQLANDLKNSHVSVFVPPVVYHQDKTLVRPVRHIAFTDYPVIGDLDPLTIAASYDAKKDPAEMTLKELAKTLELKVADDATDEQIAAAIKAAIKPVDTKPADIKPADTKLADKKPIAASTHTETEEINPLLLKLSIDNRAMKIDKLVNEHRISSAKAKEIKEKFACDSISLSNEENDAFEMVLSVCSSFEPIKALGKELSGRQVATGEKSELAKSAERINAQKQKLNS